MFPRRGELLCGEPVLLAQLREWVVRSMPVGRFVLHLIAAMLLVQLLEWHLQWRAVQARRHRLLFGIRVLLDVLLLRRVCRGLLAHRCEVLWRIRVLLWQLCQRRVQRLLQSRRGCLLCS